jgi:hypothetical protein
MTSTTAVTPPTAGLVAKAGEVDGTVQTSEQDDGWLEVARILWEGGQGAEDVRQILQWASSRAPREAEKLAPLLPAMETWEAAAGAR